MKYWKITLNKNRGLDEGFSAAEPMRGYEKGKISYIACEAEPVIASNYNGAVIEITHAQAVAGGLD